MRISDWSSDVCSSDLLAARTGVAVSAIRFYEARGLIEALRTGGGQRRFLRADIRRVSFIPIAQQMGLRLEEIGDELARLPAGRTPNGADWTRISTGLRARIDARIAALRSEEHRYELKSLMRISYAGFCFQKKKRDHKQTQA